MGAKMDIIKLAMAGTYVGLVALVSSVVGFLILQLEHAESSITKYIMPLMVSIRVVLHVNYNSFIYHIQFASSLTHDFSKLVVKVKAIMC